MAEMLYSIAMSPLPTAHVPLPDLALDAQGQPYSQQFGDVYFSKAGGAAETQHVFLQGNGLPERFVGRRDFTIGELGFGTGLNFRVTHAEFLRHTGASQRLQYIAVEKYPLTAEMLQQFGVALPEYPLRLPGWHRVTLERCTLTLGFGEAAELLRSIDAAVDAWFLDGFSPAKNPEMWEETVLREVARLSAPGATFATFTAASAVRRGLQAQGFYVEKAKGFGTKREMLIGSQKSEIRNQKSALQHVLIIGAGIAGATLARALAERGHRVTVLERGSVASGASGNPAGVLYPQLTKFYTPATAWHFTAYSFMLRQIARWKGHGLVFSSAQPGMLRLPRPDQRAADFASLQMDDAIMRYVHRAEASALAGVDVVSDGWWFPHGTWLAPAELCRALLQHENITLREHCAAISMQNRRVTLAEGDVIAADILCIATAQETPRLLPDIPMPMGISAGQISVLPAEAVAGDLRCIISHRGYVIPCTAPVILSEAKDPTSREMLRVAQHDTQYLLGATYDRSDLSGAVTEKNHAENLQHARDALPGWITRDVPMQGRTSFRATTPDRLPYVGQVADGLYVSVGHGSRGLISAPLAAEILAAQITGEMVPLSRTLLAAIQPWRRG